MEITQNKISLLNTFAGLGGNTELLDREKYEVTHIENVDKRIEYLKKTFPQDTVIKADAYDFILNNIMKYDIVWASPPCPSHSNARWGNRRYDGFTYVYPDFKMYSLIALLTRARKYEHWVVENVRPYYKPLFEPTAVVGRHCIWSNKAIKSRKFPADGINEIKADKENGLSVKDLRDKMNPTVGQYIIESLMQNPLKDEPLDSFY